MSLEAFAREHDQLPPGEQALFAEAVRRLLSDGLVWREDEDDRKVYNFLARRGDLVKQYLGVCGWQVHLNEPLRIYSVTHTEGAHRRRLNKKTTIWLLLLRLAYAEQREQARATLTRYPVIAVGDVYERYLAFFPGQRVREKTSLDEALRALQGMKVIRAANGGALRANEPDRLIELLPALEVILPAQAIAELADKLREYHSSSPDDPAAELPAEV